jgi:hypothetical protein
MIHLLLTIVFIILTAGAILGWWMNETVRDD